MVPIARSSSGTRRATVKERRTRSCVIHRCRSLTLSIHGGVRAPLVALAGWSLAILGTPITAHEHFLTCFTKGTPMSKLARLLNDMAQDASLEEAWRQDADAVMDRYELSPEERRALKDRDVEAIKRLSGIENVKINSTIKAYDGA